MAVSKKVMKNKKTIHSKNARTVKKTATMDTTFLVLILVLLSFGLIMLFSASYARAYYIIGDSLYYIKRQAMWAVMGVIAMFVASRVDYHIYRKFAKWIFLLASALLILTLFLPAADPSKPNIKRWIVIGGFQFQPSEIMKFAIIVVFAVLIAKYYSKMGTFVYGVLPFIGILLFVAILMILESHVSGTVLILLIGLIMMFVGGTKYKYFGLAAGGVGAGVIGIVAFKGIGYVQERLQGWIDPFSDTLDSTMQTYQSLLTIGSGGLLGVGLGNSSQKFLYLPEPQNDFIFAVICEELGFVGAAVIIFLFAMFVYRGFVIATKAPDKFGMMMAVGITVQIGIQALLNIAVVTNTIPNTGISLPFFSYGGTALMMLLAEVGIVLNISRQSMMDKA